MENICYIYKGYEPTRPFMGLNISPDITWIKRNFPRYEVPEFWLIKEIDENKNWILIEKLKGNIIAKVNVEFKAFGVFGEFNIQTGKWREVHRPGY